MCRGPGEPTGGQAGLGARPEATFDLKEVFGGKVGSATRRFVKEDGHSLLIEDKIQVNDSTQSVTWQFITAADVEITKGGAVLHQDGKQMKFENLSHPELMLSVIALDPPPMELDRKIENLKRIEIRLPAYILKKGDGLIRVRLTSPN